MFIIVLPAGSLYQLIVPFPLPVADKITVSSTHKEVSGTIDIDN